MRRPKKTHHPTVHHRFHHLQNNGVIPICSMYGIFSYIWVIFKANVGKYSIHGASGIHWEKKTVCANPFHCFQVLRFILFDLPNRMVERNCTYFWYGLMQFSAPTNPHCYSLLHDFRIIKTHVPMTDYRSCMMLHV